MNAKISVFVICVEVIIYLSLYNFMTVPLGKKQLASFRKHELSIFISCLRAQ